MSASKIILVSYNETYTSIYVAKTYLKGCDRIQDAYRRVAKPSRNIPTGAQNGRPSIAVSPSRETSRKGRKTEMEHKQWIFCPRAARNDLWSTALCGVLRPGLEGLQGRAPSSSRALSPLKPPPRARLGRATRSRALQAFGLQARPAQHYSLPHPLAHSP